MRGGDTIIGTTGTTIGIDHTDMIIIHAGTTPTIVSATIVVAMMISTKLAASGPAKHSGLKNRTAQKLKPFGDFDGRDNFFGNTSLPFFYFLFAIAKRCNLLS